MTFVKVIDICGAGVSNLHQAVLVANRVDTISGASCMTSLTAELHRLVAQGQYFAALRLAQSAPDPQGCDYESASTLALVYRLCGRVGEAAAALAHAAAIADTESQRLKVAAERLLVSLSTLEAPTPAEAADRSVLIQIAAEKANLEQHNQASTLILCAKVQLIAATCHELPADATSAAVKVLRQQADILSAGQSAGGLHEAWRARLCALRNSSDKGTVSAYCLLAQQAVVGGQLGVAAEAQLAAAELLYKTTCDRAAVEAHLAQVQGRPCPW